MTLRKLAQKFCGFNPETKLNDVCERVQWEVGQTHSRETPNPPASSGGWRADIVTFRVNLYEVKRYTTENDTRNKVETQLDGYVSKAAALDLAPRWVKGTELNNWAAKYIDDDGNYWWVWSPGYAGHIYFDDEPPNEDVRNRAETAEMDYTLTEAHLVLAWLDYKLQNCRYNPQHCA